MRVTFVCPPLNASGGMRVVAIYATWLSRRGHDVTVVAPAHPASGKWSARALRWLNWAPADRGQPARGHYFDDFKGQLKVLGSYRPIRRDDVPEADVLISTWWETAEWAQTFGSRKGTHVHFIQHHEVFDYLPQARVRAVYRLPTRKIVVARWLADVMREEYADASSVVVPNAIDRGLFYAPRRMRQPAPTIGTLFHETPFKGLDVALEVIARLRIEFPELRVVMFGSSPPSAAVENTLRGYGLHIDPPQDHLRALYAQCDLWLSCSRTEGFNLTAMEAMACRTPVVSTSTGWPAESIIDGKNGFLAEVDDIDALVQGCGRILRLRETEWQTMSESAFNTVAEVDWDQSAQLFESALAAAAEGKWRTN